MSEPFGWSVGFSTLQQCVCLYTLSWMEEGHRCDTSRASHSFLVLQPVRSAPRPGLFRLRCALLQGSEHMPAPSHGFLRFARTHVADQTSHGERRRRAGILSLLIDQE